MAHINDTESAVKFRYGVADRVITERYRQMKEEAHSLADDLYHDDSQLVRAACVYALSGRGYIADALTLWPSTWRDGRSPTPKSPEDGIIKAMALLMAELERLEGMKIRCAGGNLAEWFGVFGVAAEALPSPAPDGLKLKPLPADEPTPVDAPVPLEPPVVEECSRVCSGWTLKCGGEEYNYADYDGSIGHAPPHHINAIMFTMRAKAMSELCGRQSQSHRLTLWDEVTSQPNAEVLKRLPVEKLLNIIQAESEDADQAFEDLEHYQRLAASLKGQIEVWKTTFDRLLASLRSPGAGVVDAKRASDNDIPF